MRHRGKQREELALAFIALNAKTDPAAVGGKALREALESFDGHCKSACLDNAIHLKLHEVYATGSILRTDVEDLLKRAQVAIFMSDGASDAYVAIDEYLTLLERQRISTPDA